MKPVLTMALAATLLASAALALWADPPETAEAASPAAPARRPAAAAAPPAGAAPAGAPTDGLTRADIPRADTGTAGPQPAAQLPTRAADWPAPAPAGLAAWQAQAAPPAERRAAAAVAAAPASAAVRPAPVFPYRWIGQLDDGNGAPQQLLASAQRSVGVRPGATLDGRWRLLRNDAGHLLAQALPDGETVPVPGAPASLP